MKEGGGAEYPLQVIALDAKDDPLRRRGVVDEFNELKCTGLRSNEMR